MAELATVSLALVVIGGVLLASYAPRRPPLGAPAALTAVSTILLLADVVLLARLPEFNWDRFFTSLPVGAAGLCHVRRDDRLRVHQ